MKLIWEIRDYTGNNPRHKEVVTVSDWIDKLDYKIKNDVNHPCALNTDLFLDLASYLKSLPSSDDPNKVFENLCSSAKEIIQSKNIIDRMLKQQAKEQAQP